MSQFSPDVIIDNVPLPVDGSGVTQPVSGTVNVGNFPATQNVAVTSSVEVEVKNDSGSPIPVTSQPVTSNTSSITQVVLTGNTNATALASNANRKKAFIFAPKNTLYIKFGATASSTSFTLIATTTNMSFEIPMWTGQIDVLSTVNQTITVTELT